MTSGGPPYLLATSRRTTTRRLCKRWAPADVTVSATSRHAPTIAVTQSAVPGKHLRHAESILPTHTCAHMQVFSEMAPVVHARVVGTQCYAFVRFQSPSDADYVMQVGNDV
jgi:RNA recognition motif. (a.k.a. RRM, RBD, or RNP domain)